MENIITSSITSNNNYSNDSLKKEMLQSFQYIKNKNNRFTRLEEEEPSMKWANKYLEYQYKFMSMRKSNIEDQYPYDFDK